jgi:thymidylate synthase
VYRLTPASSTRTGRWWDPNLDEWTAFSHWDKRTETFRFDHTYQERIWPKWAGHNTMRDHGRAEWAKKAGIRYEYGDLDDVVALLRREPFTRQAYLPIWFPEDTGVVFGGRAPCTLGYHFMRRTNRLHMWYDIRSCDFVRHFRNDLYLASRLLLWVLEQLTVRFHEWKMSDPKTMSLENQWTNVMPGYLYFCAHSLHYFKGDEHHVTRT